MVDTKLSALPNSTTIVDSDQFYINSAGVSERIDASLVQQFIKEQKVTSIRLDIQNDGGTIKHLMTGGLTTGGDGNFQDRITGATSTLTTTPTGNDATTAFAGGGKISSAFPDMFIFDTVSTQTPGDVIGVISTTRNTTGTHLVPTPITSTIDVNGVTLVRLSLRFFDAPNGAAFNLNTTNIASGQVVDVCVLAYLK